MDKVQVLRNNIGIFVCKKAKGDGYNNLKYYKDIPSVPIIVFPKKLKTNFGKRKERQGKEKKRKERATECFKLPTQNKK